MRFLPRYLRAPALIVANAWLKRLPRDVNVSTLHGFRFQGNTADVIQRHVAVFGEWEPDITAYAMRHLRDGDHAIDVGANVGYDSCLFAVCVGRSGRVLAFEPLPAARAALDANLVLNDLQDRVTVIPVAVGRADGEVTLYRAPGDILGSTTTLSTEGYEQVADIPVRRIADYLDQDFIDRLRLVKIDIEGDEYNALLGFGALLGQLPADCHVLIEVSPPMLTDRGQDAGAVLDLMTGLGFSAFTVPNDYSPRAYARNGHRMAPRRHHGPGPAVPTDFVFAKTAAAEL